jgi:hypothetical protein
LEHRRKLTRSLDKKNVVSNPAAVMLASLPHLVDLNTDGKITAGLRVSTQS